MNKNRSTGLVTPQKVSRRDPNYQGEIFRRDELSTWTKKATNFWVSMRHFSWPHCLWNMVALLLHFHQFSFFSVQSVQWKHETDGRPEALGLLAPCVLCAGVANLPAHWQQNERLANLGGNLWSHVENSEFFVGGNLWNCPIWREHMIFYKRVGTPNSLLRPGKILLSTCPCIFVDGEVLTANPWGFDSQFWLRRYQPSLLFQAAFVRNPKYCSRCVWIDCMGSPASWHLHTFAYICIFPRSPTTIFCTCRLVYKFHHFFK